MAMGAAGFAERLAVCSWSLQPKSPKDLADQMCSVGLHRVQLALDPLREQPDVWGSAPEMLSAAGVHVVSGMFGCVGEDYSTLESIRKTGGLVPDETWDRNWANVKATADLAARMGLKTVMFHAGFLPHDSSDPAFEKIIGRVRQVARCFAYRGIALCCETGQETADALKSFLEYLNEPNVGVNFDPANMILYGNGDPVAALRIVGRWVKGVHVKDAIPTAQKGTWGKEVVVGTGRVDWLKFFSALQQVRFAGWLCLEREAGTTRAQDLRTARKYVEGTLSAVR